MAMFALAALSLWWAEARGWSSASFRVFFLLGAVVNVPWLGLGSVYLLMGPRIGLATSRVLLVFTGFATGAILMAPMKGPVPTNELPTGSDLFGPIPRILAAVGSSVPATIIFAGALWSAWRVLRGAVPAFTSAAGRRVLFARRLAGGNILIATGAAILSASGSLAGRLGADTAFAVTLLIGISVLFGGFLVASNATSRH